jgi:transcriptional antiterminator NusG
VANTKFTATIADPIGTRPIGFATLWFKDSFGKHFIQDFAEQEIVTEFIEIKKDNGRSFVQVAPIECQIGDPAKFAFIGPDGVALIGTRATLKNPLEKLVLAGQLQSSIRRRIERFLSNSVGEFAQPRRTPVSLTDRVVARKTSPGSGGAAARFQETRAVRAHPIRWYIVHAYSNFEKKVAESIREQAKQRGLEELFEQVLVPTEKVTEIRRGRKVDAERKFFPGYVLVKMNLTDEAFHLIKNTPKVTGFLGAENKPMPISEAEAMRILHQVQEGVERPKASVSFEIGENVRVADGPFASFSGVVEEIDEGRSRVKVAVSIFGRATPVELEFEQVEKN